MSASQKRGDSKKRGQVAFEFTLLIALGMVVMMTLIIIAGSFLYTTSEDRRESEIINIGRNLQNELIMAASVHEGYERNITLPERIGSFKYSVTNDQKSITISSGSQSRVFMIPEVTGTIKIGDNTIRNIGGEVIIN